MIDGTLVTAKGGNLADITSVETVGPLTVAVRTKQPDASLLFNLSDGLFGVVEKGAGRDEGLHPMGTGPFKFVSQMQDRDVLVERNRTTGRVRRGLSGCVLRWSRTQSPRLWR